MGIKQTNSQIIIEITGFAPKNTIDVQKDSFFLLLLKTN